MKTLTERSVESLALLHGALSNGTKKCIGWTVSPPANLRLPVQIVHGKHRKTVKVRYDFLTPQQQIDWLVKEYLPKVFETNVCQGVVVFEQNKSGNIHVHGICYDRSIQNDYALTSLRKNVMQTGICFKIAGINKNRHRVLNYIHFLEDVDKWLDYLYKDCQLNDYPILYFTDSVEVPYICE